MDVNLALVSGRLALAPDFEWLPDGSRRARLLVCVHPMGRGRFDVLPVVVPAELHSEALKSAHGGTRVFVAGPLMRRCSFDFWEEPSRIELIADAISFPDLESHVDRPPSQPVDEGVDVDDATRSR
jgi:hypothetical protein